MATNRRVLSGVTAKAVFDVLRDGKTYGHWVVGTRTIREVESGWPAVGSRLHYTVGYGPMRKNDETRSLAYVPDERLVLQARAWPAGSARIEVTAQDSAGGVVVTIDEVPDSGLGKLLHNPLVDLTIKLRNVETLRRLEQQARSR